MAGRFALKQDVVEVLVAKLSDDTRKVIDNNIIVKTQEQLRVLQVKASQSLLKSMDTKEVRAAILLDYVVREEKGTRLDHKILLEALGINAKKKATFSQLHNMIGNYRGSDPAVMPSKDTQTRSRHSVSLQKQHQQAKPAPAVPVENSIPRLAIRLSSLIPDPNGFADKAKHLFEEIQSFIHRLEMPRRDDQQRDIQRFRAEYEAACLYQVVAKTQTKKLSRMSKPKQKQGGTIGKEFEELSRPLAIDDILQACPGFSDRDFREVCKHVEGLVIEMDAEKENDTRKRKTVDAGEIASQATSKKGKRRGKNSSIVDKHSGGRTKKSQKQKGAATAAMRSETEGNQHEHNGEREQRESVDISIPSLYEWRDQVLYEAREEAKKELAMKGIPEKDMTESALLECAADAVFRRYGLL